MNKSKEYQPEWAKFLILGYAIVYMSLHFTLQLINIQIFIALLYLMFEKIYVHDSVHVSVQDYVRYNIIYLQAITSSNSS